MSARMTNFAILSIAHVQRLAMLDMARAWQLDLSSKAAVSCFIEAVSVNLPSNLRLLYEPELDIINGSAANVPGGNTTSLLGTQGGEPPKCKWVTMKLERERAYLFRGQTDSSKYSMLLVSGITHADDGVGSSRGVLAHLALKHSPTPSWAWVIPLADNMLYLSLEESVWPRNR